MTVLSNHHHIARPPTTPKSTHMPKRTARETGRDNAGRSLKNAEGFELVGPASAEFILAMEAISILHWLARGLVGPG
jgi:hypothetical protein